MMRKLLYSFLFFILSYYSFSQTLLSDSNPGTGKTWTIPAGVTSITVQIWGAGGAGGGSNINNRGGAGGGGGAYLTKTISVIPGQTVTYDVGTGGVGAAGGAGGSGSSSTFIHTQSSTNMSAGGGAGGVIAISSGTTATSAGGTATGGTTGGTGAGGTANGGAGGNGANSTGTGGAAQGNNREDGIDGSSPGGGGGGSRGNGNRAGGAGGSGRVIVTGTPNGTYIAQITGASTGSTTWCPGETRNVTVTIKNAGTAAWTDSATADLNIGVKWNTNGTSWDDYRVRVDAQNLAAGATRTYTLTITASDFVGAGYTTPLAAGTNNLTFDVVYEAVSWFAWNANGVGPGNVAYTTPNQTILAAPSNRTVSAASSTICSGTGTNINVASSETGVSYQLRNGTTAVGTAVAGTGGTISLPTGNLSGTTTFNVLATNSCSSSTQMTTTPTITVNPLPTTSNAGPDQNGYTAFTLAANTPTVGTGAWTIVSGPSTATSQFSSTSSPTATFTPLGTGTYTLAWTISNSCGTSTDQVVLVANCVSNLITNGDFSNGATGWSVATAKGTTVETNGEGVYFGNGSGDATAELDSAASLRQQVSVIPNVSYTLSFLYARRPGSPATVAADARVLGGATTPSVSYQTSAAGTPLVGTLTFTPTTSTVYIEFWNSLSGTSTLGTIIDNIVLVPSSQVTPVAVSLPKGDTYKTATVCAGIPIQLDVENVPASGVTYSWSSTTSGAVFSATNIKNPTITFAGAGSGDATVVVTSAGGCAGNPSTTSFTVKAAPTVYAVTGGGSYCTGGTGVVVGLTNSASGVSYQLQLNGVNSGTAVTTSGGAISFGLKTVAGTYTVVATNTSTSCSLNMSGSAVVTINPTFNSGAIATTGQTICYGGTPSAIGSTTAASGGDGTITYKWQANGTDIASSNSATYTPPAGLTATTTYRRLANDGTCNTTPTLSTGTWTVTVRSQFTAGAIATTGQTICYGGTPSAIGSTTAASGGDGTITYKWQANGTDIASSNSATYTPPAGLTATTTYRRLANDGTCNTTPTLSTGSWTVTVRSQFTAGAIATTGQTICYGGTPSAIGSTTAASGGDGTITYKWQANGTDIASSNSATYTPPAGLTATTTYRRLANDGTCNTTPTLSTGSWTVTVRSQFTAGAIATTGETICYGGTPSAIGSTTAASGGDGTITYKWQANGTDIASSNSATYTPPAGLTATTTYRRLANDGTCNTTPTLSTGSWTVTVRSQFTAGAIATTGQTICYGGTPSTIGSTTAASGGDGTITYKWQANGTDIPGSNSAILTPPGGLTTTTTYRRLANDGTCNTTPTLSTGTWTITVRSLFTAGAIATTGETICYGGTPSAIGSTTAASGGDGTITYKWQANGTDIAGSNSATYTPPAGLTATTTYRRLANDGTCSTFPTVSTGTWTVTVNQIATTPIVGTTTAVGCANLGSVVLSGLPSGTWQINQSGTVNATISDSGSSYTITGLIQGTYTFTVQTSTTCVSSPTASVVIDDSSSTVWNGTTWSKGTPDSSKSIIIASVTPNQPFSASTPLVNGCSLTVDSGVIVTVPTDVTLRIVNAVTTNGQLIFENNSSLVQTTNAVNTGEIVYKRETSVRRYDLTYWSTPVTKAGFTLHDFSPATLGDKFYYYDPDEKWVINYNGAMDMTVGRGFSIRAPQTFDINTAAVFTGEFTGIPNNGDIPAAVSANKWNLVGNPYPSAVDAVALINGNTDLGPLYLWTHNSTPTKQAGSNVYTYSSSDFAVFNLLGGAGGAELDGQPFQGYIAAGQGFICKPTTAALNFNNLMRVGSNNTQFYKTAKAESVEKNRLWLNLTNTEGAYKQTLLGYAQGATNDIDINYDATTMAANSYVDFYSINGTKKLTIQGRALPFDNTEVIPLGYKSTIAGDMTISIDHADGFFDTQEVYLEDKTTGTVTDLRAGNYTFTTAIGTFTDRFTLKYTNKTLGNEEFENLENSVLVSVKNQVVKITSSQETIKEVNIYNIGAQLLYNKNKVNASELQITNLHSTDQVILVKVTLENGYTFTKKAIFSNLK